MASGNIGDVPAATYAEYVTSPPEPADDALDAHDGASDSSPDSESASDAQSLSSEEDDAPSSAAARCLPVRPALAHRLHSHRLHVRAKAKLQRDRLLSGPMLDIYVGAAKRHWALHRNLLCHHSELLEEELSADGKAHDKLELPDHDPAGFELLVKWLYQGKLDDVSDLADANQKYQYAVSCHKLYLLCDRFDMPQLKNVAMDQYRKGLNQAELVPDADEIDEIYRQSPQGSPFRRLMTRIAARQIMDPDNERDVETYRRCFESSPDFAIELVKAIKHGTGGMLFEDPTEPGNECEYHDHDAGPNCHIKGKGKVKQAFKASAPPRRDPISVRSAPSKSFDPPTHPHPQSRLPLNLQPPPRQARRQDGISSVGPLRRRLTSPASSTVGTSTENVTATPPSPSEQRDKFRRVTPPEAQPRSQVVPEGSTEGSHPAPADLHQSSSDVSHPPSDSLVGGKFTPPSKAPVAEPREEQLSASRGIWGWAKAGTGRLGIIGRIPHPEWKGPMMTAKAATSAVSEELEGGSRTAESLDDFSLPDSTSTEPDNAELRDAAVAARIEGLGIAQTSGDPMFSQTKRSSDELVASVTGSPSPNPNDELWRNSVDSTSLSGTGSAPDTPSPAQKEKKADGGPGNTPSPHRIPKYKIALAANILAPHRTASA